MRRFSLFALLFVLAVSLLGVCQTTPTPIPNPTPVLNAFAGEWNAGLCIPKEGGPFFNIIHFSSNAATKTLSITQNGYPGTDSYNDYTKNPFVYSLVEANSYEGDSELVYTFSATLDKTEEGLGNAGDKITTAFGVVPLKADRFMALYFRHNDTQDKELYQGTVFAYRSADYTVESLSDFATEGRDLCDAIYNLSTEEQGRVLRQWAKQ